LSFHIVKTQTARTRWRLLTSNLRASSGDAIDRLLWRSFTTDVWLCVERASSSDVTSCSSWICLRGSNWGDEPTVLIGRLEEVGWAVLGRERRIDMLLRLCSKSETAEQLSAPGWDNCNEGISKPKGKKHAPQPKLTR